jgi:hypothetical protein
MQLSAQFASLTHQVQHHKSLPHDYVKLTDRIVTLEHEMSNIKQMLVAEKDKER